MRFAYYNKKFELFVFVSTHVFAFIAIWNSSANVHPCRNSVGRIKENIKLDKNTRKIAMDPIKDHISTSNSLKVTRKVDYFSLDQIGI